MLAHTRKQNTEKLEARFIGTPENIMKFRHAAKKYNVLDVTDETKRAVKDSNHTVEEVSPELLHNQTRVVLRGYRSH